MLHQTSKPILNPNPLSRTVWHRFPDDEPMKSRPVFAKFALMAKEQHKGYHGSIQCLLGCC